MQEESAYRWRFFCLIAVLLLAVMGVISRIVYLGIIKHDFLVKQSKARSVREISIPAHRGMITDRNGEPLAISIPVASIWVNPQIFTADSQQFVFLASTLNISVNSIKHKVSRRNGREFVYLKRSVPPEIAEQILAEHIPGIFSQTEYRRFYPEAESSAQVIGFTNIDDCGQEGLELAYDSWLHGVPGKMRVIKDLLGNVVANLGVIKEPQQGRDLRLSIDRRIQYLAYRELKNTIEQYSAESGSVVVLAVKTGELLAMANYPTFNPNNRAGATPNSFRNRALTDLFEPGSTMKTFSIASALESGKFKPTSTIDTRPGHWDLDGHRIFDAEHHNNGVLTLMGALQKSSDIAVAKMTLQLSPTRLLNMLRKVGFGKATSTGFPGEAAGMLPERVKPGSFPLATLSFGYGLSATVLQLAQAYAVIATSGFLKPITFLKTDQVVPGVKVLADKICEEMIKMLEAVLDIGGTGKRANIPGYHVAGKTGSAHIARPGGYYSDRYFALFAGIAPVTNPELVIVVMVKDPKGKLQEGGYVAAPPFATIMEGSLRILGVPPDDVENTIKN